MLTPTIKPSRQMPIVPGPERKKVTARYDVPDRLSEILSKVIYIVFVLIDSWIALLNALLK